MTFTPNQLNLAVVGVYLFLIVGVGAFFAFRKKSAGQFMTANQTMSGWVVGLSMFGSYISSVSFLGNPAASYAGNWMWAGFTFMTPVGLLLGTRIFMRYYRSRGVVSAYTHLEDRFGSWARVYAVFTFLMIQVGRMGTILFLLSQAVLPLLGGDPVNDLWLVRAIIIGVGLLMTFYTLFGGIEAVVWTGVLQSITLIAGPLICLGTLVWKMPGGVPQIFDIALADHKFSLAPYTLTMSTPTIWLVLLSAIFGHIYSWGIDQSYVQRYIAVKSDREAARSIWIAGLCYIPVACVFWLIGTLLYAFYHVYPQRLPAGTPPDSVFPHFIAFELLPGFSGLVIAAIFAASMDSNLNSMATLSLIDIYKRYIRPRASERESLFVLYGSTLFWGLVSIGFGLVMTLKGSMTTIDFSARVGALLGGGVTGLFLLGIFAKRVSGRTALWATLLGTLVINWMSLSRWPVWPAAWGRFASPWHEMTAGVVGTFVIVAVGLLATWWSAGRPEAVPADAACAASPPQG